MNGESGSVLNRSGIRKLKACLESEEFDLACPPQVASTDSFTQSPEFLARWKDVWEKVSQALEGKVTLTLSEWNALCESAVKGSCEAVKNREIEEHLRKLVEFVAEPTFVSIAENASRSRER